MKEYLRRTEKVPRERVTVMLTSDTKQMLDQALHEFYERPNRSDFYEKMLIRGVKHWLNNLK